MRLSSSFSSHSEKITTIGLWRFPLLRRRTAEVLAVAIVASLLSSSFSYNVPPVLAASHTQTWDSSNTSSFATNPASFLSTGATSTVTSVVDTTGGVIGMGTPTAITATEDFSGVAGTDYHLNTTTSSTTVQGSTLKRDLNDSFQNLSSYVSSLADAYMRFGWYEPVNNSLYYSTEFGHPVRFNLATHALTTMSPTYGSGTGIFLAFDSNGYMYAGDEAGWASQTNPVTNVTTAKPRGGNYYADCTYIGCAFDPDNGKIYYVEFNAGANLFAYNASTNATSSLSGGYAISSTGALSSDAYDASAHKIFFMSGATVYSINTDTDAVTQGVSTAPVFGGVSVVPSLHLLFRGGYNFNDGTGTNGFSYFDYTSGIGSGSWTNLATNIKTLWGTSGNATVDWINYSDSSGYLYFFGRDATGNASHAGKYDPALGASTGFTDLTSSLNTLFGTSTWTPGSISDTGSSMLWTAKDSTGTQLLALSTPPSSTQYGFSTSVASSSSGGISQARISSNTDSAGTGSVTYYLSNDGGTTWATATPGSYVTFATTGNDLRYKIKLTGSASVSSFHVDYIPYHTTSTLMNLKLDGSGGATDAQWVSLRWSATMPANTTVAFRTRGATNASGLDALYSATWSATTTATTTGTSGAAITGNLPGGGSTPTYRYLEIEVILTSTNGIATSSVSSVSVTYAINGAPDFNTDYPTTSAGGASSSQDMTSTNSTWGKVAINYSVRDTDTTSGTTNPGCITPSFSYRLNSSSSWTAIPSGDISATTGTGGCAAGLQPVTEAGYSTYTAYWNATSTLTSSPQYSTTAQVRVTANDNEVVNNIGYATTSAMTLDTKAPTATLSINGSNSTSTVTAVVADDSTLKDYELSNNSDFSADGSNASSGSWQSIASTTGTTLNIPWTLNNSATSSVVYFRVRDIYDNVESTSVVAPPTPTALQLSDISNPGADSYRIFLTWTPPYSSVTGATFSKYEIWRSTDGSSFSLLTAVSSSADLNYYPDYSLSSTTTYYYKVRTIDSDNDSSGFTSTEHLLPNGSGGTTIAPIISSVAVPSANIKNTSVQVTWTTNTVSNSEVDYGLSAGSYGSTATNASYALSHSVYVTGLSPNTAYYFRVKSTDPFGNVATDDNSSAGYTFTTVNGPVISNVSASNITNSGSTITWNTDKDSDSHVYYSTDSSLSSVTTAGTATFVGTTTTSGVYFHSVSLTGLSTATKYYFYVKSTDSSSNAVTDNNNGSNYNFTTTQDTTPPTISNITEPVLSSDTAVVVWTTNEDSTGQVEYGGTAGLSHGAYPSQTTADSTYNITHVATITGLSASTSYYFRAISSDVAGNQTVSDENTFTTADTGTTIIFIKRSSASDNGSGSGAAASAPPVIGEVTVDPIGALSATVNVSVAPASQVIVSYGPSTSYGYTAANPDFVTDAHITLSNLQPGTEYHFTVDAVSESGKRAHSEDQTFKTKFLAEDFGDLSTLDKINQVQDKLKNLIESALPSINPPFISNPKVAGVTTDSATVSWDTNVDSYSVLDYSPSSEYDAATSTYAKEQSDLANATRAHSITLTGLEPGTLYHFSARSFFFPQAIGKSQDLTFSTKAPALAAQLLDVKTDSFRVLWKTAVPASSVVQYTDKTTGSTGTHSDPTLTTGHDVTVENLTPGESYDITVSGQDANGNVLSLDKPLSVTLSLDTVPPTIANLKIDSTLVPGRSDIIQSVLSWKTDKPSTSVVLYDEGSGSVDQPLHNKIQDTTSLVQNHVIVIPNLKPATIYRIQISSTDQAGNTTTLPVRTIVTPQQAESIVDVIFKNFGQTFPFLNQ